MYEQITAFLSEHYGLTVQELHRMTTGVGGGVIRDLFAATVPAIFRKHIYASAAILGAAIYYFSAKAGAPVLLSLLATVAAVVIIRMLATHYRWNLPRVSLSQSSGETPPTPPKS